MNATQIELTVYENAGKLDEFAVNNPKPLSPTLQILLIEVFHYK